MKKYFLTLFLPIFIFSGFTEPYLGENPQDIKWFICNHCCKTKKASDAPWENGCRQNSSGMHNYQFCGKAGDFNYTCRKCDAEVYLSSSQSPSSGRCCATGGTHSWFHR